MKIMDIFEESQIGFDELKEILLGIGGKDVNTKYEDDLEKLLKYGKVMTNINPAPLKMQRSLCHRNSAIAYEYFKKKSNKSKIRIATGWALSKGIWDQHSWLFDEKKQQVIETTSLLREVYFGFILNNDESIDFCDLNY